MTATQDAFLNLLRSHAEAINAVRRRHWSARPFYEYLSDALVWSDETDASDEMLDALRMLLHCRTQLLMGSTCPEHVDFWTAAQAIVPKWIGFHPSRCTPTFEFRKMITNGRKRLAAELSDLGCVPEEDAG